MENRERREWKERIWTEIVKMKRTVGIYIHLERTDYFKSSSESSSCMCVYCAVAVTVCPDVAEVSVLRPLCEPYLEETFCLQDLERICKLNVILNIEYLMVKN